MITKQYLNGSVPVTPGVRDWLLPAPVAAPADLSDTLVIVPTRQAGRRLREALALRCEDHGTALIPPVVKEPLFFTDTTQAGPRTAGPLLTQALWTEILHALDPASFPGLFPVTPPRPDRAWAAHTGEQIQRLRNTLVEGGYLIRDVAERHGESLEEGERWNDLARLETVYVQRLETAGLTDRAAQLIHQAEHPVCPPEVKRIVVAAVPDPSLLMTRALTQLALTTPITLLIHAPQTRADHFDEWGRPLPAVWAEKRIDIPDAHTNVRLGSTPEDQARITLDVIAEQARHIGPSDLAIGVPDPEVAPYVDTHLHAKGLIAFNPAGKAVRQHRLWHLLEAFQNLLTGTDYRTISALLRHPDVLIALEQEHGVHPANLLTQLDQVQNQHLPQTLADLRTLADTRYPDTDLARALPLIERLRDCGRQTTPAAAIAAMTQTLYACQTIDPRIPEDEAFRSVANRINRLTAEAEDPLFAALDLPLPELLQLILNALTGEAYYEERKEAQIDLEGWLELPWNEARLLIVTGMNDGSVPDSRMSDLFLPDTLRDKLGLRSDADRLARDAYLMTTLIESRPEGRVCFIAGATSAAGDPLRPSRLLFRCEDAVLPARAAQLFREPEPTALSHPASVSFPLDPTRTGPLRTPATLGVTALGSYLNCPFRFYLRHLLRMESLTDNKAELDAMDFGSLVHHALQGLQDQPACTNENDLANLFVARAEQKLKETFGSRLPLPVHVQFESVKQRLTAAAKEQARIAREGWQPRHFEIPVELRVSTITVRGKIDRADFHPATGAWRIIDYKTRDQGEKPDKTHLRTATEQTRDYARLSFGKGKPKQWCDLQLPLYAILFQRIEPDSTASVGYFNLPRAVTNTGLELWDDLNEEMLNAAWGCAEGIVGDIEAARYWPPAEKVAYEEFETLFPFPPQQSVLETAMTKGAGQ